MDLDQATQASELLALDSLARRYGEDWPLVSEYLELFRRRPDGPLNVKVRIRLLYDLLAMWSGGKFEFNRQWYSVGREEFREALSQVCSRGLKALTNHNYLKAVLTSAAQETSKRLEKEFKEREKGLRTEDRGPETEIVPDDPQWREINSRLSRAVRQAKTPAAQRMAAAALKAHLEGKTNDPQD
jgi:hypothetical protein